LRNAIIVPLTKMPFPKRIGPPAWADWFTTCKRSVEIQRSLAALGTDSEILVLTATQFTGARPEREYYVDALRELGAEHIRVVVECYETIEQIETMVKMAKDEGKELIVVSTWLHYPRALWLLKGSGAELTWTFGIPNAKYAIMDIILNFAFPVLDVLGLRGWFRRRTTVRRVENQY